MGKSQEGEDYLLGFFGVVKRLPETILSKILWLDSRQVDC